MRDGMFCAAASFPPDENCYARCGQNKHCIGCGNHKHKWPTPAQFKKEYGQEVPQDILIWTYHVKSGWLCVKYFKDFLISQDCEVCLIACTPYGRPPADYRPEEDV